MYIRLLKRNTWHWMDKCPHLKRIYKKRLTVSKMRRKYPKDNYLCVTCLNLEIES